MSSGASCAKISTASWSARKSDPLTVSNACVSGESGPALPRAALMPPSAAPEWLRVGWSFETTATSAPASWAAIAARIPAQPAPTTSTSCAVSTPSKLAEYPAFAPRVRLAEGSRGGNLGIDVRELREVLAEQLRKLACLAVVGCSVRPRRAGIEEPRVDARRRAGDIEAEDRVAPHRDAVECTGQGRVEQRPRLGDRHAVAAASGRPARPAGVDEPDGRPVPQELLVQHP